MDPWIKDQLAYQKIGNTFTNLIQSIDSAKVISIEAGFGHGKTFFRKAWAEQLRNAGEVVIEIDVQQSDHSGDPIVTLLGALVEALPKVEKSAGAKALDTAKNIGAIGGRTVAKIILKSAADELIEQVTDTAIDKLENFDELDEVLKNIGDGMSKAAGQFIAAQMAAERIRKEELPKQLDTLYSALSQNGQKERVILIIDELDRCHPDYAIAVLEAMKLVFNQSNFVSCLMINADYLENLAQHRFGVAKDDEKYLDKFVDIRLRLRPREEDFREAVIGIAKNLPLAIPFGETEEFSIEHAAKLASQLAAYSSLSMRKVKRILLKVELALRCYSHEPLDASLLVFLAFQDETKDKLPSQFLPRSTLTPQLGEEKLATSENESFSDINTEHQRNRRLNEFIQKNLGAELANLPNDRYRLPDGQNYYDWAKVFKFLAPHYLPNHRDVLNAVAEFATPFS